VELRSCTWVRIPRPASAAPAIVALVLAACDAGPRDRERTAASGERPPANALSARRAEVRFATTDGVLLSASLTVPTRRRAPVVVLVHQFGSDRHDWDGFVQVLDRAGFATLAYDTRGMGRSLSRWPGKQRYFPPRDEERYLETMPRDVRAAVRFLAGRRDVDPGGIAVLGASFGANVAYAASATVPRIRTTVLLSPVLLRGALRPTRGTRPRRVLFVSSRAEAAAVLDLAATAREPSRSVLARQTADGHGVALLPEPAVRRAILDWLRSQLMERRKDSRAR